MAAKQKVAFGIPIYNKVEPRREAIESLLSQTLHDIALIISDDGPSHEMERMTEELFSNDARVHYFRTETRLGCIGNANWVLNKAGEPYPETPYFAWGGATRTTGHTPFRMLPSLCERYKSSHRFSFVEWNE